MTKPPFYGRRSGGPVHITPDDGLGQALCGVRIYQYLDSRAVRERPADDAPEWCAACRRHEANGTRKARRSRR